MGFAYIAAVVVYVFICFFLILVVLVQQGRGADIAGAFGGGGTQTAFGARGATTLLHKLTTGAFIGFIVLSLVLTILERNQHRSIQPGALGKAAAGAPAAPKTGNPNSNTSSKSVPAAVPAAPSSTSAAPAAQPATNVPAPKPSAK